MKLTYLRKVYRIINPTKSKKLVSRQKRNSHKLIQQYFAQEKVPKLHIGCQDSPISGWLNVDIEPIDPSIVYLDATKQFPIADNSFDVVFSEHMIEHISLPDGMAMIKECYRTLKPGGVIRLATPDLNFLIELYRQEKSEVQTKYIESYRKFYPGFNMINDAMVINNFVRNWGHQFIYDKKTLKAVLEAGGFKDVRFCEVGESQVQELQHIEKHGFIIGHDFNKLESLIIEGIKK
jgi:predicted SAM-dependent methyltransferase